MFWLGVVAIAVAALVALLSLLHWIFTDPAVDREDAIARFRAEQEYRAERRAGN
ncbi:MAG TPA: hypothetical protein VGI46_19145 [Candidatus Acidoferrum sp.]